VLMNFLCFDLFAGRADEDELFQTRSDFWDRPEVLHGVPQEGHIRTGVLSGTSGEHSMGGLRACDTAWRYSTETGGSATELSATDAWRGAAVGDSTHKTD
jgi:hypothetical protein